MTAAPGSLESERLRHVLGRYPTGVAVITAQAPSGPIGMAVNSFTSVSLDPPLVLFCPAHSSTTWPKLRRAASLAVNVLSAEQGEISALFARRGADRFTEMSWSPGENGAPLIEDALGWMECTVESEQEAGDHWVVVARIERLGVHTTIDEPLIFFGGRYYPGLPAGPE
jgi:3-hydroxy-9,10-secoandrosta-1,3,5(10)-triene-9,17-dione monooxygenase reductase component